MQPWPNTEECRRLLEAELGLEPLEETTALYEQIRSAPSSPLPLSPPHPLTPSPPLPFVGRGEEHATLVDWWKAAQRGEKRLVLVEGEAGVGKTRLVEEVARYAEIQGATVLRGRCYEFGGGVPYQPIAEALRSGIRNEKLEIRRERLERGSQKKSTSLISHFPGMAGRVVPPVARGAADVARLAVPSGSKRRGLPTAIVRGCGPLPAGPG